MRIALCLAIGLFFAEAALAQTPVAQQPPPQALTDVFACANTHDDRARLACYDAAVGRLHNAQQTGQVVSIDRDRATALTRESFGFNLPNLSRLLPSLGGGNDANLDRIQSAVTRIIERPYNQHVFVLANGQSWAQIEPQSVGNVHVGDTITIRNAALGSFMLVSPRGGAGHRVRREN